jgi:hypothetical protein
MRTLQRLMTSYRRKPRLRLHDKVFVVSNSIHELRLFLNRKSTIHLRTIDHHTPNHPLVFHTTMRGTSPGGALAHSGAAIEAFRVAVDMSA